jgi:hypothetical protein
LPRKNVSGRIQLEDELGPSRGMPLRNVPREIVEYIDQKGRVPFRYWLDRLKDRKAAAIIDARLTRVRMGNLGHSK